MLVFKGALLAYVGAGVNLFSQLSDEMSDIFQALIVECRPGIGGKAHLTPRLIVFDITQCFSCAISITYPHFWIVRHLSKMYEFISGLHDSSFGLTHIPPKYPPE